MLFIFSPPDPQKKEAHSRPSGVDLVPRHLGIHRDRVRVDLPIRILDQDLRDPDRGRIIQVLSLQHDLSILTLARVAAVDRLLARLDLVRSLGVDGHDRAVARFEDDHVRRRPGLGSGADRAGLGARELSADEVHVERKVGG